MSIEDIQERLRKRTEEAEAKKREEERKIELARLAKEQAERERKEALERRLQFITTQTEEIMTASGALNELQEIDKRMLEGNVASHLLNYSPKDGRATLAWGKGFVANPDGTFSVSDGCDFSKIELKIDPDKRTLTVTGLASHTFSRNQWEHTREIESAIDDAYIDPLRETYHYSSSSRSDSGECCSCSR